ncbi:MAG TPA: amidohydrolase, partial [Candidatus Binatia bacterium]|nr:amidohydrolase [Candidatus Binatia bacterium]
MNLKYGFISVDDHVQEVPSLWTDRVEKKFSDRAPRLATAKDGSEQWLLDGKVLLDGRAARAGALMADRNEDPQHWADVPPPAFTPGERLKAMDSAGIDYSVLYPTVAGLAGETFGRLQDSDLE